MTAALVNPYHALDAYNSFCRTTDLLMTCSASSLMSWHHKVLTAWIDWAHLLIISLISSLADMWLVNVTPSIFNDVTLQMPGSAGGWLTRLWCFSVKIILTDIFRFKVRLLPVAHCSVFSTSAFLARWRGYHRRIANTVAWCDCYQIACVDDVSHWANHRALYYT